MKPLNTAQRLLESIGVPVAPSTARAKMPSHTKKGPGRRHQQGKKKEARNV